MVQFTHFGASHLKDSRVLGSFQKNWISPELQLLKNVVSYQNVLLTDTVTLVPQEFREFFSFST